MINSSVVITAYIRRLVSIFQGDFNVVPVPYLYSLIRGTVRHFKSTGTKGTTENTTPNHEDVSFIWDVVVETSNNRTTKSDSNTVPF